MSDDKHKESKDIKDISDIAIKTVPAFIDMLMRMSIPEEKEKENE